MLYIAYTKLFPKSNAFSSSIGSCSSVFIEEQEFKNEFDDTDETCSHIVLYDGGKCIATCRYY